MRKFFRAAALIAPTLLLLQTAPAGHPIEEAKHVVEQESDGVFEKGTMELQIGVGGWFAMNPRGGTRPRIDDIDGHLRLGWILNSPDGDGFFRGNFELLGELFGAAVIEGPGDGYGGVTLMLRYNFVQLNSRLVPYFQIGAGGVYNDIYKDHSQRLIGGAFEFNLQSGLGVRFFATENCAIFLEGNFRHISNANTHDRNCGLNSIGGVLGASYFF